jgi:CII-binding regulator of phage lambda lysogenization HflD
VPWDLYTRTKERRLLILKIKSVENSAKVESNLTELGRLENIYLFLTVLSPILCAVVLQTIKSFLGTYFKTIQEFNTTLFLFAAWIRPFQSFVSTLKETSDESLEHVLSDIKLPSNKVEELIEQVQALSNRVECIKKDLSHLESNQDRRVKSIVKKYRMLEHQISVLGSRIEMRDLKDDLSLKHTNSSLTLDSMSVRETPGPSRSSSPSRANQLALRKASYFGTFGVFPLLKLVFFWPILVIKKLFT